MITKLVIVISFLTFIEAHGIQKYTDSFRIVARQGRGGVKERSVSLPWVRRASNGILNGSCTDVTSIPAIYAMDRETTTTRRFVDEYEEEEEQTAKQELDDRSSRASRITSSLRTMRDEYAAYVSTMVQPRPPPPRTIDQEETETEVDRRGGPHDDGRKTSAALSDACVPNGLWTTLHGGDESFHDGATVDRFSRTAVRLCADATHPLLEWHPDRATQRIVREHGDNGSPSLSHALRHLLPPGTVLVWTAKFRPTAEAYGAALPVLRTRGLVSGLSPRDIASLLLDSSRVTAYNTISVGRTDVRVFQRGVDTVGGDFGDGETKIVLNVTKPPLVKKRMQFRTMMHARRLRSHELGDDGEEGYIMASRAVPPDNDTTRSLPQDDDAGNDGLLTAEILLGVNLLRSVSSSSSSSSSEQPSTTDMTSVTHVNSPLVHPIVAGKVGMKGAIDFFNCVRAMGAGK